MLEPIRKKSFKKDIKAQIKRKKDMGELRKVIDLLIKQIPLPAEYDNHPLHGNYQDNMECHIEPDWLLIYRTDNDFLYLIRTGTHSDLF